MSYTLISAEQLVDSTFASVLAKDNVCLNHLFQALVHGQIDALNRVPMATLRGLSLNEFRAFNPAKFSAKEGTWSLDKERRTAIMADLNLAHQDNSQFSDFADCIMEMVNESREKDNQAMTAVDNQQKAERAKKTKETKGKKEKKLEAVGGAVERELKREGESFSADELLDKVLASFSDNDAMILAMKAKLETLGYSVETASTDA